MNRFPPLFGLVLVLTLGCLSLPAQQDQRTTPAAPAVATAPRPGATYVLSANDILELKVYREDDMETKVTVAKDGTASFPLIGTVRVGGFTVEQASELIRRLLDRDYIVNPQVTLSVVQYAKRRFTVLGQVGKPGTYEMPGDETRTTLLQAVAVAGGFTRLAKGKVIVSRNVNGEKVRFVVDASEANDPDSKTFEVLPDDILTVPERFF